MQDWRFYYNIFRILNKTNETETLGGHILPKVP